MHLISEKRYDQIAVNELVERASVSRATLYLHYADKDALFAEVARQQFETVNQLFQAWHNMRDAFAESSCRKLFGLVAENSRIYSLILCDGEGLVVGTRLRGELLQRLEARLEALLRADEATYLNVPVELLSGFAAHALVGQLSWWLARDLPFSAETMAQISRQLQLFGIMPFMPGATVPLFKAPNGERQTLNNE